MKQENYTYLESVRGGVMEFFGMGTLEIVLVIIVALLIFGPGKLPEMARQAGKIIASLKQQSAQITAEVKKELEAVEAAEKAASAEIKKAFSVDQAPATPSTFNRGAPVQAASSIVPTTPRPGVNSAAGPGAPEPAGATETRTSGED